MYKKLILIISIIFFTMSCAKDPSIEDNLPSIDYLKVSDITFNSVTVSGKVSYCNDQELQYYILIDGEKPQKVLSKIDENGYFQTTIANLSPESNYSVTLEVVSYNNSIVSENVSIRTLKEYVIFDDGLFEQMCLIDYDTNHNGLLELDEASHIQTLSLVESSITNVNGIEKFVNLQELELSLNDELIGSIDLSNNTKLTKITSIMNQNLKDIVFGYCPDMTELNIVWEGFILPDLDNMPHLKRLIFSYGSKEEWIITQELKKIPELEYLDISGQYIYNKFDLSANPKLSYLNVSDTGITSIDISSCQDYFKIMGNYSLEEVYIRRNQTVDINFYYEYGEYDVKITYVD